MYSSAYEYSVSVLSSVVSVAMVQDSDVVGEGDGTIQVCAVLTGPAGGTEREIVAEALATNIQNAGKYNNCKKGERNYTLIWCML